MILGISGFSSLLIYHLTANVEFSGCRKQSDGMNGYAIITTEPEAKSWTARLSLVNGMDNREIKPRRIFIIILRYAAGIDILL
jgi:hypothetical protein